MLGKKQRLVKNRFVQGHGQVTRTQVRLREIDNIVDFTFFRNTVAHFFSPIGRKSIDPVVMLKMMFLGYLCALRSDSQIIEECIDRQSFREFLGYDEVENIPAHTNFSNWRKRIGPEAFEDALANIVAQCEAANMRLGNARLFDSSRIKARASISSSPAKAELELAENLEDYLQAFEWQTYYENPKDDPRYGEKLVVNSNDPEARLLRYSNEPSRFMHKVHWEVDCKTGLVVNTTASHKPEHEIMLDFLRTEKRNVISVCADAGYSDIECYKELERMGVKAYIPFRDHANDKGKKYHHVDFIYDKEEDIYTCPNGKRLRRYVRDKSRRRTGYKAEKTDCACCPMRDSCIDKDTNRRTLTISDDRPYIETIKQANQMSAYKRMMRRRKTVMEGSFAHAKTWCGMTLTRGLGLAAMRIQAAITAMVINVKKLVAHVLATAKNEQKQDVTDIKASFGAQIPNRCLQNKILRHLAHLFKIFTHFEAILTCQCAC